MILNFLFCIYKVPYLFPTGYEVSWEDSNKSLVSKAVIDVQATLSLTSNQTYFVTVVAKNSHNFTSKAASVTIQTPPGKYAICNTLITLLMLLCFL